jgi:hypothetical protein
MYLNLHRIFVILILIGLRPSEHSETSFEYDFFSQLVEISIDFDCSIFDGSREARNSNRTRKKYIFQLSTTRRTHR